MNTIRITNGTIKRAIILACRKEHYRLSPEEKVTIFSKIESQIPIIITEALTASRVARLAKEKVAVEAVEVKQ